MWNIKQTVNRSLLLTGGTGFIGKSLLRYWMNSPPALRPSAVHIPSRDPTIFASLHPDLSGLPWLRLYSCNILDRNSIDRLPPCQEVIHAAADASRIDGLSNRERSLQIVEGTQNIIDWSKNAAVSRFLYVSSGAAYGRQPDEVSHINESAHFSMDPLEPSNAYGMSKRLAEEICISNAIETGISLTIARCFTFVGQDLPIDSHFAIGNFISDALHKQNITVSGDGTAVRSYMDQRDMARWLDTILRLGADRHIYNVGSDQPISIIELASLVRDVLSPDKMIHVQGRRLPGGAGNRYVPATLKARNELGLKYSYNLKEAIRFSAYRSNQIRAN